MRTDLTQARPVPGELALEAGGRSATRAVLDDLRAKPVGVAVGVAAFVAAMVIGARISVPLPITPVPMTLQVPVVLLAGAVLGPAAGLSAVLAYLALGASGAPVFAAGGGLAYLLGPTGGYLVSFPLAAWLTGMLARPGAGGWRVALAIVAGVLTVHAGGMAWLMVLSGQGVVEVLSLSFLPFLVGDVVEIALVWTALRLARPALFHRAASHGVPRHGAVPQS